MRWIVKCLTSF